MSFAYVFSFLLVFLHAPGNSAPSAGVGSTHSSCCWRRVLLPHGWVCVGWCLFLCCAKGLFVFLLLTSPCTSAVGVCGELCASVTVQDTGSPAAARAEGSGPAEPPALTQHLWAAQGCRIPVGCACLAGREVSCGGCSSPCRPSQHPLHTGVQLRGPALCSLWKH